MSWWNVYIPILIGEENKQDYVYSSQDAKYYYFSWNAKSVMIAHIRSHESTGLRGTVNRPIIGSQGYFGNGKNLMVHFLWEVLCVRGAVWPLMHQLSLFLFWYLLYWMNGYVESFTHSVGASEINGTMKTKLWKSKQKFGSPNETLEEIFRTRFEQGISLGEIRAPYLHARTAGRAAPQTTHENMSKKRSELRHGNILNGWRAFPLTKMSQTNVRPGMVSFTELYIGKPVCKHLLWLPCCAIVACSKVGNSDLNSVIQMNPWITNFLLLVISSHKSRVVARKIRQLTAQDPYL